MKVRAFIDESENTRAENKLLRLAVLVIGLASIISGIMSYSAVKYQKVVILPPIVDKRIEISGTEANDDYFKLYAKYITGLLMNYTPTVFDDQAHDLLSLCSPGFYPSLEKKLSDISTGVKKLDITSVFYPFEIRIDRSKQTISVTGDHEQHAKGISVAHDRKSYIITYQMNNGRLQINDINEEIK